MLKEAIEKLVGLGKDTITSFVDDDGNLYINPIYKRIINDYPDPIETSTLTSVLEFVKENISYYEKLYVVVNDVKSVSIKTDLDGYKKRSHLLEVSAEVPNQTFDRFIDSEDFIIGLMSKFVPTPHTEVMLKALGNITENTVKNSVQDGVTQSVTVKSGVATVADVQLPKTVVLKPFRTFTEIEQPESEFVLRVKEGPECALFEADGGAWKNLAIARIKEFLTKELHELIVDKKIIILA